MAKKTLRAHETLACSIEQPLRSSRIPKRRQAIFALGNASRLSFIAHGCSRREQPKQVKGVELKNPAVVLPLMPISPGQLQQARLITAQTIEVVFADGLRRKLLITSLGVDIAQFNWNTVKVSPSGEAILVKSKDGQDIPIDSASVRCLVDPVYATKVKSALNAVRLSRDELRKIHEETEPPAGWQIQFGES